MNAVLSCHFRSASNEQTLFVRRVSFDSFGNIVGIEWSDTSADAQKFDMNREQDRVRDVFAFALDGRWTPDPNESSLQLVKFEIHNI